MGFAWLTQGADAIISDDVTMMSSIIKVTQSFSIKFNTEGVNTNISGSSFPSSDYGTTISNKKTDNDNIEVLSNKTYNELHSIKQQSFYKATNGEDLKIKVGENENNIIY